MADQQQQQFCRLTHVPLEVRLEPTRGMRNVSKVSIEEWVARNGGLTRGGLIRCRLVVRGGSPLVFLAMADVWQNNWLLEMARRTAFDNQLMACAPENFIRCWVPTEDQNVNTEAPGRPSPVQHQTPAAPAQHPAPAAHQIAAPVQPVVVQPRFTININGDRLASRLSLSNGRGRGLLQALATQSARPQIVEYVPEAAVAEPTVVMEDMEEDDEDDDDNFSFINVATELP